MRFEALYDHCASLPHATVSVQWGDHNVFKVGGKMFAIVTQDLDLGFRLSIKADPEEFDALCGEHGVRPAPYMARNMWVQIVADNSVGPDRLRELVSRSRDLVFEKLPPRQQQALTTGAPTAASARPKTPRKGPARSATAKRKAASKTAATPKPPASKTAATPKPPASKAATKRSAVNKVATKRPAASKAAAATKRPAASKATAAKRPAASKAVAAKRPAAKKVAKRSGPSKAAGATKGAARARRGA